VAHDKFLLKINSSTVKKKESLLKLNNIDRSKPFSFEEGLGEAKYKPSFIFVTEQFKYF